MTVSPAAYTHGSKFLETARASWPTFGVDAAAFEQHVASRTDHRGPPPVERAADLFLAFACSVGDPEALRALDRVLRDAVARSVCHVDSSPDFADDVAQELREKLLVARPAKIAEYAGRATLRSWLSTSALRVALNLRRRKGDAASARSPLSSSDGPTERSPDLAYLKARYSEHFADALRDALASLPPRDRGLLRMHLREKASIDDMAAIYRVGRSTTARWLAAAKARLVDETQARLCERLGITPSEYESLAAVVRSDVEISVLRLLDEPVEA